MTAPLRFEDVALPELGSRITLEVPEHRAVVVTAPEASGVDALPGYALALKSPAAGRVLLFGEDVAGLSRRDALAFRRQVGYLPAGDGLLHNLSLKDNVALPLRYGSDLTEREIDGRIRIMLTMGPPPRRGHRRAAPADGSRAGAGVRSPPGDPGRSVRRPAHPCRRRAAGACARW
jgi:ABC-type lipoprotein export system ATPase subunit